MAFLIRTIFWFSLVLLMLPLGSGSDEDGRQNVGPFQAFFAARDAVSDLSAICERKPDVCNVGWSAFHTIKTRAGESARIAYEILDQQFGEPDPSIKTGSVPVPEMVPPAR